MTKFHINKHGVPAPCNAKEGNCPLGGEHFDNIEKAQVYIDQKSESEFGILPSDNSLESRIRDSLSDSDIEVLNKLNDAGFQAYVVGGSVRDNVIGVPTNDVDITTSATPDEINEVFKDYKCLDTGNEHGTVPVIINGVPVEITTFRNDGDYTDGRRPDNVTFTKSLEEDMKRRDFTINAIAYSEKDGVVDLVGGVSDAENGLIRAVGSPNERFKEDPLRILRGLRFASKLDFEIDPETHQAMIDNKGLLKNVSAERIQAEFNGLIQGKSASKILTANAGILSEAIPGIKPMIGFDQKNPNHIYDVWEHSANVTGNADEDLAHKLAGVFHDAGKPSTFTFDEEKQVGRFFGHAQVSVEIADKALRDLKYPNKIRERVLNIIEDHDENLSTKSHKIKMGVFNKGPERFFDMLNFKRADDSAKNPTKKAGYTNYDKIEKVAREYLADKPILSHKDLAIKPEDIIKLGYKGADIGKALHVLSVHAISGHKNDRESQIEHLKKHGLE